MLRKRQGILAVALAAALLVAAAPPLRAEPLWRSPLAGTWEAFTGWLAARLALLPSSHRQKSGVPLYAPPSQTGGSCGVDSDGVTTTDPPPQCTPSRTEGSSCIDPNG